MNHLYAVVSLQPDGDGYLWPTIYGLFHNFQEAIENCYSLDILKDVDSKKYKETSVVRIYANEIIDYETIMEKMKVDQ